MIAKAISDDGNPTLETFLDLVAALDGNVLIEWKDTTIQRLERNNAGNFFRFDAEER
jgi:hypothetical protein